MIRPARGRCLVRKVQTEETMPGGRIIIPERAREKLAQYQVQIAAIGANDACDDDDCPRRHGADIANNKVVRTHPTDSRITTDAWAIVQPRSFVDASVDGDELYVVKTDDVLGIFRQK